MKNATKLHAPTKLETLRNVSISLLIAGSLFTPPMAKADPANDSLECRVETVNAQALGEYYQFKGVTNCPGKSLDIAVYCDGVFQTGDGVYTNNVGAFSTSLIAQSCEGKATMEYGFDR